MLCEHFSAADLQPPGPSQSVHRDECTQCCCTVELPGGIDVCLHCYNGGCETHGHSQLHANIFEHPLAVNIQRTLQQHDKEEISLPTSKLAVVPVSDDERYETTAHVKCITCGITAEDKELDLSQYAHVKQVLKGVMSATTFTTQEEAKSWELQLSTCEHILMLSQQPPRQVNSQDVAHCSDCELNRNLWLCLECGNLACGRSQFGGTGGNGHGLQHFKATGHCVAIKLGSISPDNADIYCYTCDDEKTDDDIARHLANWGIILADRNKTEKSLTELQIEQNHSWDFAMSTADGTNLRSRFGPGFTGIRNIGNSCYIASVLQCLFHSAPFKSRYFTNGVLPASKFPAQDLDTQLVKLAHGLLSGEYSVPDSNAHNAPGQLSSQRGISPGMLKAIVGQNHPEFSTMRQQDAVEFMQHLFKLVSRASLMAKSPDPTAPYKFELEQRVQCVGCRKVRYTVLEQDNIMLDVPLSKDDNGEDGNTYRAVEFTKCLELFTASERVDMTCSACGSKDGYEKSTRFKSFPDFLIVTIRKMTVVNWVPVKVDVPIIVLDESYDLTTFRSAGKMDGEDELPTDTEPTQQFVPDTIICQDLEDMGFPRRLCERALVATGNCNLEAAMEWALTHSTDPDIDCAVAVTQTQAVTNPDKVKTLEAMGISTKVAEQALAETDGDLERAVDWVFSHPPPESEHDGAVPTVNGDTDHTPIYELDSFICHKGASIHSGHYVAVIREPCTDKTSEMRTGNDWVLFNDEKVVDCPDTAELKRHAYIYIFKRTDAHSLTS